MSHQTQVVCKYNSPIGPDGTPEGYEGRSTWEGGPIVPSTPSVTARKGTRIRRKPRAENDDVRDTQCRAWCFTSFALEDVDRIIQTAGISALVIGEEVCPDTSRIHYQGYVRFENNKRFSWWKNQFPGMHVEPRKGSEGDAAAYCRKDGKILVDRGCEARHRRSEDTSTDVLNMLEDGAPLWQVYKAHRVFFFHNAHKIERMDMLMNGWRENCCDFRRDE